MRPALYVFVRKDLGMSAGKIAAQVVQASAVILEAEKSRWITHQWLYRGGHHMTLVMESYSADHLRDIGRYLKDRGFESFTQIDEGYTEVAPLTPTALAVQPVNKDDPHVAATFSQFSLYKDDPGSTLWERVKRSFTSTKDAHGTDATGLGTREARGA